MIGFIGVVLVILGVEDERIRRTELLLRLLRLARLARLPRLPPRLLPPPLRLRAASTSCSTNRAITKTTRTATVSGFIVFVGPTGAAQATVKLSVLEEVR